jgi:hypothetical protein
MMKFLLVLALIGSLVSSQPSGSSLCSSLALQHLTLPPCLSLSHPDLSAATTYSETFRPYPILPRDEGVARQLYEPGSTAKFEGHSETHDAFRAWAIDPAQRRGGPTPPMRPALPFDGTTTHKDMFQVRYAGQDAKDRGSCLSSLLAHKHLSLCFHMQGWQLPPRRPALGVQMLGDQAYILIPANAPIPALGRQLFSTVHDNQEAITVLVLEGDFSQASKCR